jgi:hypothetical protein
VRESAIERATPPALARRGGIAKQPAAPAAFYGMSGEAPKLFAMKLSAWMRIQDDTTTGEQAGIREETEVDPSDA